MIKAVLFDIDGTLLDSHELIRRSFEHTLKTQGVVLGENDMRWLMGQHLDLAYKELFPKKPVGEIVAIHRDYSIANQHLIQVFPETKEILEKLKDLNIHIAAITNRQHWPGVNLFEEVGFDKFFEVVVCADDVVNPKPHPEPVLKALSHFSITPDAALMVGDSESDIKSGRDAGVRTVGVTHGNLQHPVKDHAPDHVISSLLELLDLL